MNDDELDEMDRVICDGVRGKGCPECCVTIPTGELVLRCSIDPDFNMRFRIAKADQEAGTAIFETLCCGLQFETDYDMFDRVEDRDDTGVRH